MFLKISIFKLIAEAARVSSVENIFTARPRAKFQPRASPREAGGGRRETRRGILERPGSAPSPSAPRGGRPPR